MVINHLLIGLILQGSWEDGRLPPCDYGKGPGKIPRRLVGVDKILDLFWGKLAISFTSFLTGGKTAFPSCQVCFTRGDRVFLAKLVFADLSSGKSCRENQRNGVPNSFFRQGWLEGGFGSGGPRLLGYPLQNQQPTASRFLQDGPEVTSYKL